MLGFVRQAEVAALEARVAALERRLEERQGRAPLAAEPAREDQARREAELARQWDNFWAYDGRPQKDGAR